MEREQRRVLKKLSLRERLFESLFGYPLRLAEQVTKHGMFKDDEEYCLFHANRLNLVDEVIEQMKVGKDEQS